MNRAEGKYGPRDPGAPQLGAFSKISLELRWMIWEYVFDEIHSAPFALAIMCCSRHLYREISDRLFEDFEHEFRVESGLRFNFTMKQTCSQGWELKNIEDVRRHLHNFPWARVGGEMFVNISPPVREDPGQIVQIWQKVTQLVNTLNTAPSALSVWVTLLEDWSSGEKPQQSIPYTTATGYRPDHDIAILPFTYLSNWYYRTSPAYSATIENERELPRRSFLFKYGTDCALNEWRYIATGDFSNWHIDTRIFLDRKLDHLPGETAGALRLERFQNWFQDGWVSEYEAQFTADLQKHQNIVQKHDPGLVGVRRRHKLLILLHHIYHASNDDQEKVKAGLARMHPLVYEEWDSQFWSNCWGNYIPALSFQLIENRLAKQYWYRVYWNYRKFTVFGMILRGATSTTFNIHDSEWN